MRMARVVHAGTEDRRDAEPPTRSSSPDASRRHRRGRASWPCCCPWPSCAPDRPRANCSKASSTTRPAPCCPASPSRSTQARRRSTPRPTPPAGSASTASSPARTSSRSRAPRVPRPAPAAGTAQRRRLEPVSHAAGRRPAGNHLGSGTPASVGHAARRHRSEPDARPRRRQHPRTAQARHRAAGLSRAHGRSRSRGQGLGRSGRRHRRSRGPGTGRHRRGPSRPRPGGRRCGAAVAVRADPAERRADRGRDDGDAWTSASSRREPRSGKLAAMAAGRSRSHPPRDGRQPRHRRRHRPARRAARLCRLRQLPIAPGRGRCRRRRHRRGGWPRHRGAG